MSAAMIRTRRALEAILMARKHPGRPEPGLPAIILGLAAFVSIAAACLYLVAALGG